ncbi:hypothetical protein MLD38_001530 [Melastoma candidum]|uniref:Uncharacterized protein n=1 Tax=Melastoma candidum TaxID=119954 RepID=A0ACB9SDL5_9MYRT|nr:hypothetical protein MLD38_001530 [Melastoma candidum]
MEEDGELRLRHRLSKFLHLVGSTSSTGDLFRRPRSSDDDEVFDAGMKVLYSVLKRGVEPVRDGDGDREKPRLRTWTDEQVQGVCAVASAVAFASRSLEVDAVDPIVVAVTQQLLEFAVCCLEYSDVEKEDLTVENTAVHLLETALVDGAERLSDHVGHCTDNEFTDFLLMVTKISDSKIMENHRLCHNQGCVKGEKSVDQFRMSLPAYMQQLDRAIRSPGTSSLKDVEKMAFLSQHWAVAHTQSIHSLILFCKQLVSLPYDGKTAGNESRKRLTLNLKIFRLLLNLVQDAPFLEYDLALLEACAQYADALPYLFSLRFECLSSYNVMEGNIEVLILSLLEDFLRFLKAVFSSSCVPQNVQACIVASLLDGMAASKCSFNISASSPNFKPMIAYLPRAISYIIKLINEINALSFRGFNWQLGGTEISGCLDTSSDSAVCHVRCQKLPLLESFSVEELMKLIFPSSGQWLDSLIHLVYFLFCEGAKQHSIMERSYSCTKVIGTPEIENAVSHEDEALFGNLFCESIKSVASADGCDQVPASVNGGLSSCNLFTQAATELLTFLKESVFSSHWQPCIFEDACRQLSEGHIDVLLSIIDSQASNSEDKAYHGCGAAPEGQRSDNIPRLSFSLLHNLVVRGVLVDSLENYLVESTLKVQDGVFVYNGWTLCLLAHILFSRVHAGSNPRKKIFDSFSNYIVGNSRAINSAYQNVKDFVKTLPSAFHLEILLVTLHLSSTEEKTELGTSIVTSLGECITQAGGFPPMKLSCWAMLVSRLILILRHLLFYPRFCPPSLCSDLRTKLTTFPVSGICPSSYLNDYLPSWASVAGKSIVHPGFEGDPGVAGLICQMIDSVALPPRAGGGIATDCLWLRNRDIHEMLSGVTALWKEKKATSLEDLIIERYIFALCWDTPSKKSTADDPVSERIFEVLDLANMCQFFEYSHYLLDHCDSIDKETWSSNIIIEVLKQISALHLPETTGDIDWGFFRSGMWLSLVLSTLIVGTSNYCLEYGIEGVSFPFSNCMTEETGYSITARKIMSCLIQTSRLPELTRMLFLVLDKYVQTLQNAVVSTLTSCQSNTGEVSPPLLLIHTGFNKHVQDELVLKSGVDSWKLAHVCELLLKTDAAVWKRSADIRSKIFWEFMMHGFPALLSTSSAILLSCILNIRRVVFALAGLLRIQDHFNVTHLESKAVYQALELIMAIKSNHIFKSIDEQCRAICDSLSKNMGGFDLSSFFLLKQMENFLDGASSGGNNCGVLDCIIDKFVDVIDDMRKDPSGVAAFKFYLGVGKAPEEVRGVLEQGSGNLMILIDALDTCHSETVNVKVFNFFISLLSGEIPDLKDRLQQKFLLMDTDSLSQWLEERLLGCKPEASDGDHSTNEGSVILREATIRFLLCLVSILGEQACTDLQSHLFEALLTSLDYAFLLYDIHVGRSYFHFVTQFVKDDKSVKLLLQRSVLLIGKLSHDARCISGLKFIIGFLGSVLKDGGSYKSIPERSYGKSLVGGSVELNQLESKQLGAIKGSDASLLGGRESGASVFDGDATSVDEDDDDGTSDGELASLDKDEEGDSNSERALASKVCTFTSSGSNFMEQHWYFCYTCDLVVQKGCCSVCAKVCHRGHRVVYSRSSRFFCDCGAGGVIGSNCQCLKPRKFTGSSSGPINNSSDSQSYLPLSEDRNLMADSESDLDDDIDVDVLATSSIARDFRDVIPCMLKELDMEGRILELCEALLPSITGKCDLNLSKDKKVVLGDDKVLSFGTDLLHLKKAYKSGSLDLKIKADYSNTRELKSHLTSGSLVKSLLSVSSRGKLAVGEGDKVAIFDVGQLIGQATVAPVTADKSNVKPLSKNVVRFEIVQLAFNLLAENYLAVAGYEDCQVLTLNSRGEVTDRLAIELALQGSYIRRIEWVPGSQTQLLVVSNRFVKIYDLSQDNISPVHYFTLPDERIVDAMLFFASLKRMFLLVLSENGKLYRLELSGESNAGAKPLKEVIKITDKEVHANGSSLYFSSAQKLLFISYHDGTTLIGQLSSDATALIGVSPIYDEEQDTKQPAGLHHWKELLPSSGLFACISSIKSNAGLVVSFSDHDATAQIIRHALGSSAPLVGITAYKPLSKDKVHCLALHDDGSLQIYSYSSVEIDPGMNAVVEKVKKLGYGILNNKAYAGSYPEFPLDFFEKTVCITSDVKFGGDAIHNGDSEGAKQNLANEDGFLESPSTSGFKISVSNSNPDIVMVGFRLHVGHTSPNHIPSSISIFQRVIKLDEGMRFWYDVPFTDAESLLADEEFVITVGPTFNGSGLPRIDYLEIYGRSKDEFGWKEKMDEALDLESHVPGGKSLLGGRGRKFKAMQAAPIDEQVIADGLKLLSKFYTFVSAQECMKAEEDLMLTSFKCKQLLQKVFESEKEPLLQAAASRVLRALFPKKEMYYQVKDTMRLHGVVKSAIILSARLGNGATTGEWVIGEFTARMQAVSKIALQRRKDLAKFLEINGSEVVDGLMQVLWGILELEQPDPQTLNDLIISSVELIYCYAECLVLHGKDSGVGSVKPAVTLLKQLLLSSYEAVQTASSLAISSRLLQVPFPKQTIMTSDDALDSTVPSIVSAESASAHHPVMIEEDSITSSVQYCCDGCSTVPILRRRWHCTICPDFDLCETCHEVLTADRLPPPHSVDHLMTAIPIEVESLGGPGPEGHYSAPDVGQHNFTPSVGLSMQNSAPSIHILEPHESEDYSSIVDSVSISASKREINSLLLSELLEQLKGWMGTTSGVQAIRVMQLFYRLSSSINGPLTGSSSPHSLDFERLIKWFLDEINIERPFDAKARSSFGEVTVLVLMFFTLMLRNWQQPGSSGSSQNLSSSSDTHEKSVSVSGLFPLDDHDTGFTSLFLRACTFLRQQSFVNFLMDILQQLLPIFKSPSLSLEASNSSSAGSGCGALLSVRRDFPSGNFSPFFSDSYVKAHHKDIFMDYHRLLLENTFRLLYTLIRPERHEKSGEKEADYTVPGGKNLKLDGYQDVLCSYINNPQTSFVRRYARRLFLHLCGSKTQYYSIRDAWQYSNEVKKLYKHVSKSAGFQNPFSYERSVKIIKCLSTMSEVASLRPRNWQKYCLKHGDVLPFLLDAVFHFGEESVVQTVKLINLAFYSGKDYSYSHKSDGGDKATGSSKLGAQSAETKKKRTGEDGDVSSEKSYLDMEAVADIFAYRDGHILTQFIDSFLLAWNLSSVRSEAKSVLHGIWHHGKQSLKETLLVTLLQKVRSLPMYGQNIVEYTELITWLLGKASDASTKPQVLELVERCLTNEVIGSIFETLHAQNELLANHPNSRIYNTLSSLVEFDGYYLESEPCVACSSPEVPYSRMKLETLKSETKFTDNRIILKCTGSYTIQTVSMNVHDARKSKSVKVLNLYYNNRPVTDLSELKNNWSLWKRAKNCHLAFNQTELKVEFPVPITACNFMIELDSFYENLQALSMEPLQCPRCSRPVTDRHGICGNCHENAYQCRQCRNINYENLDSFLCNECGYSKYGRFEFNFMAKPSFTFDDMENDEDMKRGLAAIETESENAHRRYQQLLGFKKPLLKIVSSIGENEMDSQQKDPVQQMMVSLPGPSFKINRKIALLGVLYGEKSKAAFDSVSKSVQTLQGLRRVLMKYLHHKQSDSTRPASRLFVSRSPSNCYGCAITFVTQCLEILHVLSKCPTVKKQLVATGILSELFENNLHQGPKAARVQARTVLCAFSESDCTAVAELNSLIQKKVMYCLEHHRSIDVALASREELFLLSEVCSLSDDFWESRLRVVFQLLFSSIKLGSKHPAISEHVILPCLKVISQACTPPKTNAADKEQITMKPTSLKEDSPSSASTLGGTVTEGRVVTDSPGKNWEFSNKSHDLQLVSYSEWEKGASYIDFVRRQYKVSQAVKFAGHRSRPQRNEYLALKYVLRWRRRTCRTVNSGLSTFELGSWVKELILSACSQSIRSEICLLIGLLSSQSSARQFRLLNLLIGLLPETLSAGESAAEYFELLFKMIDSEDARLFLTARGCLSTICKLIRQEVGNVESLESSLRIDISQGFILHKLVELLSKFLEIANIRSRFMRDNLLSEVLEALIVIRRLIVQKTKLINDCNRLLNDLLDGLLLESSDNKRKFIRACISGLQLHGEEKKGQTNMFILEQLCNLICPSKPESVYLLVLNKAHTQEEFIRGSMTKNPYSSSELGPLMRDVKNKICNELDLFTLLDDDFSMELLVAGNIISLDLSIAQVFELVWKKSVSTSTLLSPGAAAAGRDGAPMTVTYRLQGLDGEATEPMIKELEEEREESQDPEVEFAIAGAVQECGGLEVILGLIKRLRDDFKSNQEQMIAVLNLLMHCCKIRENRRALLRLGALGLLLESARSAFSVDAMELAEVILLIVESLTLEANESDDISLAGSVLTINSEGAGAGEQAKKIVLMFLERLCLPVGKKSSKQQRNTEMVARILPYLTYGEPDAMETLVQHFSPFLRDWNEFNQIQKLHEDDPKDEDAAEKADKHRLTIENFVRVSESLKTSSSWERLKDIILEKGIIRAAVDHLNEAFAFAVAGQAGFKAREEWASALKLPSVPLILSMLRGLSIGHLPTQKCIDEAGVLPLLHALEGVVGENEIGARAENLLDTLSNKDGNGDGFLEEKVRKLRDATTAEMRRLALRKREELLKGLGMRQELAPDGGERIVVARPILEGLEDVQEEEDGLACMVCREGYGLRPTDLLGVYTFSKRVNLGVGTLGSARGDCVYTTVSSFNVIHFQCHQEAKRADAALKNPKKEWEGATLRNNESLCNSLFPLRGPSVPPMQYMRYVDQYWDNLNSLGRADGNRLRLMTYDIVLMLARFATGARFNAECRGGGRESNSRFLPFMIQMARHLLEEGSSSQRQTTAKLVSAYLLSSPPETSRPSTPPGPQSLTSGTDETVQFMMVNSLLSESYESWLQHRRSFLQRGIYHAYVQHTHGRPTTGPVSLESRGAGELLSIIRPMLVYTGLIEQLQTFFKVQRQGKTKSSSSSAQADDGSLESWEVAMKEKLYNAKEMMGFSKELVSWLDEMGSVIGLQEAFDVMGVLGDVLSGGLSKCEEFVYSAINAGKS